jgi:sulfoxide reductase heme-binding subunit YedZ
MPFGKALLLVNALVPLAYLLLDGRRGRLGANPIEFFLRTTGTMTLVFLLLGLAVTPARRLLGRPGLVKYRRMLGLLAFTYATAHLGTYLWFEQWFSLQAILQDVIARPFILVGMLAFFLMVPLAVTSTDGWVRRLGGKRWQRLHRRVYLIAALGVVHYWMLVKADRLKPLLFGLVLAMLLGARLVKKRAKLGA